jgi:predicted dehydrogenase
MGKHALVENRYSHRWPRFESCLELSHADRLRATPLTTNRFEPHIARLKQILDSGNLGRIYLAKFFYGNGTARDVRNSPWRDNGLGVFSDLGSHMLDMAHFPFRCQWRRGGIVVRESF